MRRTGILGLAVLVALLAAAPAVAQNTLTAYVVHGIPGNDFDLDPTLPVDVSVSGLGCALTGFEFGNRVGPLTIPAGTYDITIRLANASEPCTGTTVIALPQVALPAGVNATIIAHRTADGSAGAGDALGLGVTASIFPNDFTPTANGASRIVAHHTALAPTVDVVLSRNYANPHAPGVTVPGFTNPTAEGDAVLSQINTQVRPGAWELTLELAGAAVFGPDTLNLRPFTTTYVYAVGDFVGGSFQYLIFTEGTPKPKNGTGRAAERERSPARR